MLSPRGSIRDVPAYHPPLAGREGLRLDFNENTIGCSPRVIERMRSLGYEDLARYPEREPVEKKIAEFLGLPQQDLLLTNGVDEAIHLLCQTYLDTNDEALIVVPTYSMYRIYMASAGADVITVPANSEFRISVRDVCDRITNRTRMIAIANPNNPTGTFTCLDQLLEIARSAPEAAVLIDEAYFEFCGQTILSQRNNVPNLFITRTFSKVYGLAGLRAGVLIGPTDQMPSLRRVCSPYNVNAAALACIPEAISDRAYINSYVSETIHSRTRLESVLQSRGIQYWPSQANFVLAKIGSSKSAAQGFVEQMRRRGILVRDRSADHGCEGCVRFTVGPSDHLERLIAALDGILDEFSIAQGATRS